MIKIRLLLFFILLLASILRMSFLQTYPPGLFTDEANQGFNAFTLLHTGKDEHGVLLPISLRSFGDWKPPLQTYLSIPFIAIYGLSSVSVRFPSVILGIISVSLAWIIASQLRFSQKTRLLICLLLAISPWHLHQSRSAMLVMVALTFFEIGIIYFLKSLKGKILYIIIMSLALSLAIYSYYGMRVIVPLFFFFLLILYRRKITNILHFFTIFTIFLLLFLSPLIVAFIKQPDVILGRARTISVFYDRGIDLRIWESTTQDGINNVFVARFFHNKPFLYILDIARRFFSHLDGQFLFLTGDTAPPFRIPNMGVFYFSDGVFFLIGLWILAKKNHRLLILLSVLVGISFLPASLTFMTPSANRTFNAVLPITVIIGMGVVYFFSRYRRNNSYYFILIMLLVSINVVQFSFYLGQYYKVLYSSYADEWVYGFKELVAILHTEEVSYDRVVFLPKSNVAYIYFLFYDQNNSLKLLQTVRRDYRPDEFGYEHVKSMGKYIFMREGTLTEARREYTEKTLFVGVGEEITDGRNIARVYYPNGKVAYAVTD